MKSPKKAADHSLPFAGVSLRRDLGLHLLGGSLGRCAGAQPSEGRGGKVEMHAHKGHCLLISQDSS